jgi:hypothetical protein
MGEHTGKLPAVAIRRALLTWSRATDGTFIFWPFANGSSQSFCSVENGGWKDSDPSHVSNSISEAVNTGSLVPVLSSKWCGKSRGTSVCNAMTEERKADVVTCLAFRVPILFDLRRSFNFAVSISTTLCSSPVGAKSYMAA